MFAFQWSRGHELCMMSEGSPCHQQILAFDLV